MRIYALTVCAFLAACSAVSGPPSLPRGSQPVAASPSPVARPQLLGGKRDQILYAFNGVSDGAFPAQASSKIKAARFTARPQMAAAPTSEPFSN